MNARTIILEPTGEPAGVTARIWNRVNKYEEDPPFVEKTVDKVTVDGLTLTGIFSESAVDEGAEIGLEGRMNVDFTIDRMVGEQGREERLTLEVENRRKGMAFDV